MTTQAADSSIEDPLPPGRIAMWLLLASDGMFFLGLIGAVIVLRKGNANLFDKHVAGLSKPLGLAGVLAMIAGSVSMLFVSRSRRVALLFTLIFAGIAIGVHSFEYSTALSHHTITARDKLTDPLVVFDGHLDRSDGRLIIAGYAAALPTDFDPHLISQSDVAKISVTGNNRYLLPAEIFQDVRYGPSKNIFYASWFTLTGAHLFHVAVAGMALIILLVQSLRNKASAASMEYAALFWHFTTIVSVLLFWLLYL